MAKKRRKANSGGGGGGRTRRVARRVGRGAKSAMRGGKATLISALTGGLAGVALELARENETTAEWVEKPWLPPLVLGAAGHFMKRKPKLANAGTSLAAVAGFLGGQAAYEYMTKDDAEAAPETQGINQFPVETGGFNTFGLDGAYDDRSDAEILADAQRAANPPQLPEPAATQSVSNVEEAAGFSI